MPSHRARVTAAFAAVYVVWGSTYLAMKYAVASLPPFWMSGLRFVAAGGVLYAWSRARGAPRPTRVNWRASAISGTLLVLGGTALVGWAEQWVPSGIAALLVGTVPLWFVLMEWLGPDRKRPTVRTAAGIVLGFVGFGVLVGPDLATQRGVGAMPAAMILFSSFLWALGSLYTRRAALPDSPTLGMGMEMLSGGAICIAVGLVVGEGLLDPGAVSAASWLALGYLVAFGSLVGFTCYLWLLRVSTPSRVATHIYVNPVVALLLGWAIAGEPVTIHAAVATVIIVGGVALITTND